MSTRAVPVVKVGTKYCKPNWRFEAVRNPQKYDLGNFCFSKPNFSGCLKRHAHQDLPYEINQLPKSIEVLTVDFPLPLKDQLTKEYGKLLKSEHQKKVRFFNQDRSHRYVQVCNLKKLQLIDDQWLKKIYSHYLGVSGDAAIDYAVRLYFSDDSEELFKYFGLFCFAGYSDAHIAHEWNIPLSYAQAIHYIFFDFSFLPKGRLSRLAVLRQMVINGILTETDFALYKRVFDLGELGLRAQLDFYSLTENEQAIVRDYLKNSIVENTFKFQMAISNSQMSKDYNDFVTKFAKLSMYKEELGLLNKRNTLIDVQIRKMQNAIDGDTMVATEEDMRLLDEARQLTLRTEDDIVFTPLHELT